MRVLVTRPEPGAGQTAERLRQLGHEPVVLPLSRIVGVTPTPVPSTLGFLGTIITSANAVTHMPVQLHRRLSELPCYVVGRRTADAAAESGFDVRATASDTSELVRSLAREFEPGDALAYACGRVRMPTLEQALSTRSIVITAIEVYDTIQVSHAPDYISDALQDTSVDAVLVYSVVAARQVKAFLTQPGTSESFVKSAIYCLSKRIADEFSGFSNRDVTVAPAPNEAALLEMLNRN